MKIWTAERGGGLERLPVTQQVAHRRLIRVLYLSFPVPW